MFYLRILYQVGKTGRKNPSVFIESSTPYLPYKVIKKIIAKKINIPENGLKIRQVECQL